MKKAIPRFLKLCAITFVVITAATGNPFPMALPKNERKKIIENKNNLFHDYVFY